MATINIRQNDNLYKAFGSFIEGFRYYIVLVLSKESGDTWPALFKQALSNHHEDYWNEGLRKGTAPEALIDYQYLKSFAIKFKDLLRADFGKEVSKLPSELQTIYDVRNKVAHFAAIETDEFNMVFILMKKVAKLIQMTDLEEELSRLHKGDSGSTEAVVEIQDSEVASVQNKVSTNALMPWFLVTEPHLDIKQGRLDESVFAANLAEVALNSGREIYNNPVQFFSKTYFTLGLKNIARRVVKSLNGQEDAENRVISLQTGFGGGKTHTLISLYHLCKWGKNAQQSDSVSALLKYTGLPEFESANIAVFTNTTNDPANGRKAEATVHIQTLWGELAYQLGGKDAYELVRKNDEQLIAPGGIFKKVLEMCKPALILIDELADYCVKASARMAGNSSLADQTISFMQELTEAVAGTNHCVAVITLPASPQEVGNTPEAQAILNSLQKRVSRVGADTQPVADDEIYEVIRRRLFDTIAEGVPELVASKYMELYQEYWAELPGNATKSEYKQKIIKSYPFHPELIDIFRIRWASHHDFQRTRGALRLLAAIVSDLWKRQQSLPGSNLLIHSGQVNFANVDALSGQLKRLYGNGYDAVITADIAGSSSNAFKIDGDKTEYGQYYLTQGIASVILMNSFGSDGANKGISVPEIKLHLLFPQGFNHNSVNGALDQLKASAYYLYYTQSGSSSARYWFHTKPNINILINQAKADVDDMAVSAEILKRIRDKEPRINGFRVLVDPSEDIPEQTKPTLVVMHPKYSVTADKVNGNVRPMIEKIATKRGNSERIYRNTLLFLLCNESTVGKLNADVREYLACQKISLEYQSQLEKEQKEDVRKRMEESAKQVEYSITVAYSIVAQYAVKNGMATLLSQQPKSSFDEYVNISLKELLFREEWLLQSLGIGLLRRHNLIPSGTDMIKVKDVYEAFLRFDDKPMITGPEAVAESLQRYCQNGEFAIATGENPTQFKNYYYKVQIAYFDVNDSSYWIIDPEMIPKQESVALPPDKTEGVEDPNGKYTPVETGGENETVLIEETVRKFHHLLISGKVSLDQYTELFKYFIAPFTATGYQVDIEVSFKIKGTSHVVLDESKQQYKNAKEAAKQLGLKFEEGE